MQAALATLEVQLVSGEPLTSMEVCFDVPPAACVAPSTTSNKYILGYVFRHALRPAPTLDTRIRTFFKGHFEYVEYVFDI